MDYTTLITNGRRTVNFQSTVSILVQPILDLIQTLTGMNLDIDTSVGDQLDKIGEWIGQSRDIPVYPSGELYYVSDELGQTWRLVNDAGGLDFSREVGTPSVISLKSDDGTTSWTIGVASDGTPAFTQNLVVSPSDLPFLSLLEENSISFANLFVDSGGHYYTESTPDILLTKDFLTGYPKTSLSDTDYRTLLRSFIAANQWDGTLSGLKTIWNSFSQGTIYIQDNQDMSMLVVSEVPTVGMIPYLLSALKIRPAGVKVNYYTTTLAKPPGFGFDLNTTNIAGFDQGSWLIQILK